MRWISLLSLALLTLTWTAGVSAQDEAEANIPKTPIQFVSLRALANGDLELVRAVAETRVVEQTYTVNVPVTETMLVDGEERTVTKIVPEQRTRTVAVMVMKQVAESVPKGQYKLYLMSGARLDSASPKPQAAVLVGPGEKLDVWYRSLLKPETVVVVLLPPKDPAAGGAAPPELVPAPAPAPVPDSGGG